MNLYTAVVSVFNNYVNTDGRARRSEYWYFYLFSIVSIYGLIILGVILSSVAEVLLPICSAASGLLCIATIIPSITVGVRRMHDVDKSGWYLLIPVYSLILLFTEGTRGNNSYGSDPKEELWQPDQYKQTDLYNQ